MIGLVLIVVAGLFIYLVLLRPQRRARVDQARMLQELQLGDEVVTAGGIYGRITGFDGDDLMVEIAPGLEVKVARRAIGAVIPPEELEEPPETPALEESASYPEESR